MSLSDHLGNDRAILENEHIVMKESLEAEERKKSFWREVDAIIVDATYERWDEVALHLSVAKKIAGAIE